MDWILIASDNQQVIDNQYFGEGSITYPLPINYRKQSISNPLIGHQLEKVIDCIEWDSLDLKRRGRLFEVIRYPTMKFTVVSAF